MRAGTVSPTQAGSAESGAVALSLRGVGRRYGSTVALEGVDLDVRAGEVHAIVGENGAGKSTCLSILAGRVTPSHGSVRLFGEELPVGDPRAIRRAGVASIYQELTIIPLLSTQANVFLGQDRQQRGVLREREMRERFVELCGELGVDLPLDVEARKLSVSGQQLLEILRGLAESPRVMLFDEPTATLAEREREALHRMIRDLRARGITIIFISHNLDEVLALADTVTVFRGGRLVSTRPAGECTKSQLVAEMIGRDMERAVRNAADTGARGRRPVLRAEGIRTRRLRDVEIELRRGEVVGLGGLVGSGRTTLLQALAGALPDSQGHMWIDGEDVGWPATVRRARRLGITMVPEDRKDSGVFHHLSSRENIAIGALGSVSRFGIVSRRALRDAARQAGEQMGFSPGRLDDAAGGLSGGNQQKLLLARAALTRPAVLLADEPTRGVDVGAKEEIMRTIRSMAADGLAVAVASSELEDLELLCDRVVVLSGGEVAGEITDAADISVGSILQLAFRVEETA